MEVWLTRCAEVVLVRLKAQGKRPRDQIFVDASEILSTCGDQIVELLLILAINHELVPLPIINIVF
jgi:hypothetical protein